MIISVIFFILLLVSIQACKEERVLIVGDKYLHPASFSREGFIDIIRKRVSSNCSLLKLKVETKINWDTESVLSVIDDILLYKPTKVLLAIGTADLINWNTNEQIPLSNILTKYDNAMKKIISKCLQIKASITLLSPFFIDEVVIDSPYEEAFDDMMGIQMRLVIDYNIAYIDVRSELLKQLEERNAGKGKSKVLTYDGIILNKAGNKIVSDCILWAFFGIGGNPNSLCSDGKDMIEFYRGVLREGSLVDHHFDLKRSLSLKKVRDEL